MSSLVRKSWFAMAAIFLLGMILYANILHSPFQFDDQGLLLENPYLRNIPNLLKHWDGDARKFITILTFAINYYLGGENTFGYHLLNVLLHIGTAFLLYRNILLLFFTPALSRTILFSQKEYFTLFVSLIFVAHPLQTESVTYIWQRSEVLSGFFYLLAFLLYLMGRVQKRKIYFIVSFLIFYTGLFVKGIIISLPLLIILTEISFFNLQRKTKIRIVFYSLLFLISLAVIWYSHELISILRKIYIPFVVGCDYPYVYKEYVLTEFEAILLYLKLSFIPWGQNLDHGLVIAQSFFEPTVFLSFLGVMLVLTVALYSFKKQRLLSFGIFWFFIYLAPTLLVISAKPDAMWEHRVYLSIAGFAIFFVTFLYLVISYSRVRNIILIGVILIFSELTVARNSFWQSPIALMEDTIRKSPYCARPHVILGTLYYKEGSVNKAFNLFKKAIALNPDYPEAYNNLGLIYMQRGDLAAAKNLFKKAIGLREGFATPYLNLAHIAIAMGNFSEAENLLNQSLKAQVTDKAYVGLGKIYKNKKRFEAAEEYFKKAIEINPARKTAHFNQDINTF